MKQPVHDNIDTWLWTMINTMNSCRRENLEKDQRYNRLCHDNRLLYAKVSSLETRQNDIFSALETALLTQQKVLDINQTLEAELQKTRGESNATLQWASQQLKTDALSCKLQHHNAQTQSEQQNDQTELDLQLLEEGNEQKGETEPVRKCLKSSERSIEYTGLASSKSLRSRRNLHRGLRDSPLMK